MGGKQVRLCIQYPTQSPIVARTRKCTQCKKSISGDAKKGYSKAPPSTTTRCTNSTCWSPSQAPQDKLKPSQPFGTAALHGGRLCPDQPGDWSARQDLEEPALSDWIDSFICTSYEGSNPLYRHGTVNVATGGHYLAHADPLFFVLGDTAWNGPMASSAAEWEEYLADRVTKRFSAVLFPPPSTVPRGTPDGRRAYDGRDHIRIDPDFFQNIALGSTPSTKPACSPFRCSYTRGVTQTSIRAMILAQTRRPSWPDTWSPIWTHHVIWDFVAEAQFHEALSAVTAGARGVQVRRATPGYAPPPRT